ncbi:MAG: metallophosphoesterase family protein [Myxococcaceae bacterium]
MSFRFVHAADLHLDSPFRGLGSHRALQPSFQLATVKALSRIVGLCLREKVSFLVLAGDLYDTRDRSVRARLALRAELARLDEAGILTFIVHGNHDPLSADPGALSLPASVKVFGASWEEATVPAPGGGVLCRVQGVSYPFEAVTDDLSRHFGRKGPEFTVGLLHANVGAAAGHAAYSPCALADLAARGLDYWALGHVHTRAELLLPSGGLAVYPGNPQGRHVGETGERGCVLVEVDGASCTTRFFPVDVVRWHKVSVDLSGQETLDGLLAAAFEAVSAVCGEGHEAHAVRLTVQGRGVLHAELGRPGALPQLEDALAERFGAMRPPVLLESVKDDSLPPLDLERLAVGGGLAGAVLEAAGNGGDLALLDRLLGEDELQKLEAALRRAGLPGTREKAASLLRAAAVRAVELLVDDGEQP